MAENTKIEWADHTQNFWIGCTNAGPGCDNCYAETMMDKRLHVVKWGAGQPRDRTSPANWSQSRKWNARHDAFFAQHGRRQRVFANSLSDFFDKEVPAIWRVEALARIATCENLDFLLLTKRIGIATRLLEEAAQLAADRGMPSVAKWIFDWLAGNPPANVWLGATIVNQAEADRDIPKLLAVPAAKRFLSMEPLLGTVDLRFRTVYQGKPDGYDSWTPKQQHDHATMVARAIYHNACLTVDWVIVGGESGPKARPMHPDWVRSLRDQCEAAGVAFHFKQWGEWHPAMGDVSQPRLAVCKHTGESFPLSTGERPRMFSMLDRCQMHRVGKKAAGRHLDGRTWDEVPPP